MKRAFRHQFTRRANLAKSGLRGGNDEEWKAWKAIKRLPPLPLLLEIPSGLPHSHRFDDGIDISKQLQKQQMVTLKGHTNWINAVALTADGRMAVSASRDETIKVWEVASGSTGRYVYLRRRSRLLHFLSPIKSALLPE